MPYAASLSTAIPAAPSYDVIVVGARCAGSPTAMLLARKGYRVLLLDRAAFPSDSMRAHFVRGGGVACLERWGLLDRVAATGCPPVARITIDLGDGPLTEPAPAREGVAAVYAPRRYALDAILVEEAAAVGAEVRERFTATELLWEGGRVVDVRGRAHGKAVAERARLVIGADGLHSFVARAVAAPSYDVRPAASCCYYAYFAGVPLAAEVVYAPDRFAVAVPTNDRLSLVAVSAPIAEFAAFRGDVEGAFFRSLERAPRIAAAVRVGRRAERWRGTADLPNLFRRPHGPGWALVGDAGYHQDPLTARGISNAFRDAGLSGRVPLADALAEYGRWRDEAARPGFDEAVARAEFRPFLLEVYAERAAFRERSGAGRAAAIDEAGPPAAG